MLIGHFLYRFLAQTPVLSSIYDMACLTSCRD